MLTAIIELKIGSASLELYLEVYDRWSEEYFHYVSAIHKLFADERKGFYRTLSAFMQKGMTFPEAYFDSLYQICSD